MLFVLIFFFYVPLFIFHMGATVTENNETRLQYGNGNFAMQNVCRKAHARHTSNRELEKKIKPDNGRGSVTDMMILLKTAYFCMYVERTHQLSNCPIPLPLHFVIMLHPCDDNEQNRLKLEIEQKQQRRNSA